MLQSTSINHLVHAALHSLEASSTAFECNRWRSNGFSDTEIFQLILPRATFAIRSWPNRFDTPSKVAYWSNLNRRFAATENGLKQINAVSAAPFPNIYDWNKPSESNPLLFHFENQFWTLSDWVVARSMASREVDRELAQHLARVLGRMHAETCHALDGQGVPLGRERMQSHSLVERLKLLNTLNHRLFPAVDRSDFFSAHQLTDRLKHCIATVIERKADWERFLKICSSQERNCHWIVRDLWRENILLDSNQRFSAIVDLGAARLDWPGLDFIRLFGSLSYRQHASILESERDTRDVWQEAYAAYTHEHPDHAIASLDECKILHVVSSGLSIVQWVVWISEGTISVGEPTKAGRVVARVAELCDLFLIESSIPHL